MAKLTPRFVGGGRTLGDFGSRIGSRVGGLTNASLKVRNGTGRVGSVVTPLCSADGPMDRTVLLSSDCGGTKRTLVGSVRTCGAGSGKTCCSPGGRGCTAR